MPANRKNLNWYDITDFTPGVFGEVNLQTEQLLIPQNGFARMQCYYPLKQGGVRAFYATSGSLPCTGRTSGSHGSNNEASVGLFAHGAQGGENVILVTHNSNDHKDRVYFWPGACSAGAGPWCVEESSASLGGDTLDPADFEFFFDGTYYYYVLVRRGENKGIATITYDSTCAVTPGLGTNGYWQTISAPSGGGTMTGPMGINGARLVVGDGSVGNKLWWTEEGALSFDETVTVPDEILYPHDTGAGLKSIVSMQPDTMLIGRGGAPWVQITGDIGTSGTSREMAGDHTPGNAFQQPARVPGGIAFIENGGYIYVTDGNTFQNISTQLPAFSSTLFGAQSATGLVGPGQLSFINGFLFAPDGKVLHWDTQSWFTLEDSTAHTHATTGKLWYTIREDGSPVNCINMFQGSGAIRATCGHLQTAPFADKDGRNVVIREVQVFLQSYTASGPCATVTCDIYNGDDVLVQSRTPEGGAIPFGRNMLRFLFAYPKDDYLSVRICADGQGSNEAPTIERLRIGFSENNDILGV